MSASLRKGWCPGALRPMEAKDGLLVRLRPTGGILTAKTAHAVADLAERYGNGLLDLTARANLQMRGVLAKTLPALQDGLQALGLLDDAGAEAIRNVIASPLAGLHDGIDIRPLVAALEERLRQDQALHALPGKFGFLIDDGSRPLLTDVEADVRFEWDGARFTVGLGGTAEETVAVGSCVAENLWDEAARIARMFLSLAAKVPDARRMRDITAVLGVENLFEACSRVPSPACGRRWPDEVGSDEGASHARQSTRVGQDPHPALADARTTFSRKREKEFARDMIGLQTFQDIRCLGLAALFGRLDAAMLRAAARVAQATEIAELRLTPFRVILIPGGNAVAVASFITDPADPRLAVAACVGATGCARGTTDTHADATALATSLTPGAGITMHVSGCEKGCAKASATAVTLVAHDGRYDLVRNGRASDTPEQHELDLTALRQALATELEPA